MTKQPTSPSGAGNRRQRLAAMQADQERVNYLNAANQAQQRREAALRSFNAAQQRSWTWRVAQQRGAQQ